MTRRGVLGALLGAMAAVATRFTGGAPEEGETVMVEIRGPFETCPCASHVREFDILNPGMKFRLVDRQTRRALSPWQMAISRPHPVINENGVRTMGVEAQEVLSDWS